MSEDPCCRRITIVIMAMYGARPAPRCSPGDGDLNTERNMHHLNYTIRKDALAWSCAAYRSRARSLQASYVTYELDLSEEQFTTSVNYRWMRLQS
jgi:hypothetical protein